MFVNSTDLLLPDGPVMIDLKGTLEATAYFD